VAEVRCDRRGAVGSVWRQFSIFSSSCCFLLAQRGRLGVLDTLASFFPGSSVQTSLEIGFDLRRRVGIAFSDRFYVWAPRYWLRGQGFHLSALLTKEYFSTCKLTEFVENGTKQSLGPCGREDGDRGNSFDYVVYDTTGNSALPVSQRSSEWKRLMARATEDGVELKESPTYHLFGNFYATSVNLDEMHGGHSGD
jgi:hypothetical protein